MKHNFKELQIWQLGMAICRVVHTMSKPFPPSERYELTSKIRRAVVSIPSNIAAGCGCGTNAQLVHFIDISLGSSCELETQMLLANDFNYCQREDFEHYSKLLIEFQRKARVFRDKLVAQSLV